VAGRDPETATIRADQSAAIATVGNSATGSKASAGAAATSAVIDATAATAAWCADGIAGRHVFISSLTASIGIRGIAPYSATKSGLMGVVRTLAVEWAERASGLLPADTVTVRFEILGTRERLITIERR
jgi:NAD(P)-dependent dehydrogenase (short-subunit alcohol dehydrogenase family)